MLLQLSQHVLKHAQQLRFKSLQVDAVRRYEAVPVRVQAAEDVHEVLQLELLNDGLAAVDSVHRLHPLVFL